MDDNYIFNPLCYSKSDVETFMKQNHISNNYSYIWRDNKYKDGKWSEFMRQSLENLLDSTNLDYREDRLINRITMFYNIENKFNIFPLAENQEIIECSVDFENKLRPIAFTVSHYDSRNYFDTLILSKHFEDDDAPLYYNYLNSPKLMFEHSGDVKHYRQNVLLHQITIDYDKTNSHSSGIYTIQGYNRTSLLTLKNCDPNLCIMDYSSNGNIRIYNIPCPLSPSFVKDNHIAHMAYFEYIPHTNKIRWTIPKKPIFTNIKIDVGDPYQYYKPSVKQFINIINEIQYKPQELKEEEIEEKMEIEEVKPKSALIIQETLFYEESCQNILDTFIEKQLEESEEENKTIYSFHRKIKEINRLTKKPSSKLKREENNAQYTIPIAGGSVISDHAIVLAGERIENQTVAEKFNQFLKYGERATIILSDCSKAANIPKVHSKINATFILVGLNIRNIGNINDILNNIDASLLVSMQGSLSRVIVYLPTKDEYFFYRGLGPYALGEKIKYIDEIYVSPMIVRSIPLTYTSLNVNKVSIVSNLSDKYDFEIDIDNDEPSTILEKIINSLYNASKNLSKDEVINEMRFICSQLEVWLRQTQITKMIEHLVNKAENMTIFKMKDALTVILNQKETIYIPHYLTKRITRLLQNDRDVRINKPYSRKWFTRLLFSDDNDDNDDNGFIANNIRTNENLINIMNDIIKKNSENMRYWIEHLANILDRCVSLKTAYGKRIKGIEQRIRDKRSSQNVQKVKQMTEEDIDDLFQNECTKNGVLIVSVNTDIFENIIANNSYDNDNIIKQIPDFDRSNKELASSYLPEASNSALTFLYRKNTMLMIPCLKIFEAIFQDSKSICEYNWRAVKEGGSMELVRILLRESVFRMIPSYIKKRYNINAPSSEIIGKLVISLLFGCLHSLKNIKNEYEHLSNDDFVIAFSRVLIGLILSIMASGANVPLSTSYQIILGYQPTSFKFTEEEKWLRNFLNIWPQTKIVNLPLKNNILNCLYKKLNNKLRAIKGYEQLFVTDYDLEERKNKRKWIINAKRPLVEVILESKIEKYKTCDDETFSNISKPHIPITEQSLLKVLKKYNEVKEINDEFSYNNHLFKHVALLENIWRTTNDIFNEDLLNIWNLSFSCANDIYIKYSPEVEKATKSFINDGNKILNKKKPKKSDNKMPKKSNKIKIIINNIFENKFIKLRNIYDSKMNYWENPIFTNNMMPRYIRKLRQCNNLAEFENCIKLMSLGNPERFYELKNKYIGKEESVVSSNVRLNEFDKIVKNDNDIQNMFSFYDKYSQEQLCVTSFGE